MKIALVGGTGRVGRHLAAEALRGHDAVASAFAAPPEAPLRVADAAQALVDAARAAGVRRLVVVGY